MKKKKTTVKDKQGNVISETEGLTKLGSRVMSFKGKTYKRKASITSLTRFEDGKHYIEQTITIEEV